MQILHISVGYSQQVPNAYPFLTILMKDLCSFYCKELMDWSCLEELLIYTKVTKENKEWDLSLQGSAKYSDTSRKCGTKA